jgi:4-amino-4-deoxy-L-arabinose transferase-like glycosyltransferase
MTTTCSSKSSTTWLISKRWDLTILAIIVIGSALLRIPGISHGIGYHPDERHMVQVTSSLSGNSMNPKSFAYGSVSFYAAWGFAQLLRPFWPQAVTYDGLFYSGRIFCTVMGTLTVALTYYLAIILYRRSVIGLLAAFLMGCNVFHLQLSRYFTSDITLTTFSLISIIALVKAHQRGSLASFLLFGLCAGLATATKISSVFLTAPLALVIGLALIKEWPKKDGNIRFLKILGIVVPTFALLGLTLFLTYWKGYPKVLGYRVAQEAFLIPLSVPFLAALAWALRSSSLALSKLFACLAVATLAFTLAEPFAILDFSTFVRQTQEQTSMVRGLWRPPYTVQYERTFPYLYHLKQMLWFTMGWPVFVAVTLGFLVASGRVLIDLLDKIFRGELATKSLTPEMIPLVFAVVFFVATGHFQVKFPRYLMPLYPMLFIFAGALLASLIHTPRRRVSTLTEGQNETPQKLVASASLLAPVDTSSSVLRDDGPSAEFQPEPVNEHQS